MEMTEQVLMVVVTAAITGAFSSIGTISALKTHIAYIKETLARHEREFTRVHTRIDEADPACHFKGASFRTAASGHENGPYPNHEKG